MSLTPEQRVEREKQRRDTANARMREKVAEARKHGMCRCGGQLDMKPGTTRIYSTCPDCRKKGKASATRYYREGPLRQQERLPPKLDERLRDSTGIQRRLERDGFGREAWWWIASALINGKQRSRRWSVDKHSDHEAWRLAIEQRQEWEKCGRSFFARKYHPSDEALPGEQKQSNFLQVSMNHFIIKSPHPAEVFS